LFIDGRQNIFALKEKNIAVFLLFDSCGFNHFELCGSLRQPKIRNSSFIELTALKRRILQFSHYLVLVDLIASSMRIIASIKDHNSSFIYLLSKIKTTKDFKSYLIFFNFF